MHSGGEALAVSKQDLLRLERANAKVQRLTLELESARGDLRQAIIAAKAGGESVSEIARRLGVTRARVYQHMQ